MCSIFSLRNVFMLLTVCFVGYLAPANALSKENIQLRPGDIHVIETENVSDVVVGNETLIAVQVINNDMLVVKALGAGATELLIRYRGKTQLARFNIDIKEPVNNTEEIQLKWLAENMPELTINHHDNFVLIAGALADDKYQLLQAQAELNPHWLLQIETKPKPQGRMIELEVKILEVKRQYAQQLGVRWPGSYTGPQVSDTAEHWITLPVAVQSTLNLLEQSGHARVLAEPKLVALSGEEAEFLVGGEFPIPQVVGEGMQDVEFREYGIALTMLPMDLGEKAISTAIKAEISTIDPATAVNGIPGMLTRRVSSSISASSGELIVLSGLLSQEHSKQADDFPLLNDLPILGGLFSSKQFRTAETELLVIVSPRFKSDREKSLASVEQARDRIEQFRSQISCVGLIDDY